MPDGRILVADAGGEERRPGPGRLDLDRPRQDAGAPHRRGRCGPAVRAAGLDPGPGRRGAPEVLARDDRDLRHRLTGLAATGVAARRALAHEPRDPAGRHDARRRWHQRTTGRDQAHACCTTRRATPGPRWRRRSRSAVTTPPRCCCPTAACCRPVTTSPRAGGASSSSTNRRTCSAVRGPTITSAPAAHVGRQAAGRDAVCVARAVLIRPASVTHTTDMAQRHVELAFSSRTGGIDATAPPSPSVAPPGWYMLFVLDAAGIPSVASWVHLGP